MVNPATPVGLSWAQSGIRVGTVYPTERSFTPDPKFEGKGGGGSLISRKVFGEQRNGDILLVLHEEQNVDCIVFGYNTFYCKILPLLYYYY